MSKRKNPRCQFELKVCFSNPSTIKEAWKWCVKNLQLKDEHGIIYQINELYIITCSQKVIDKVNNQFGSNFSFYPFRNQYIIDGWNRK